MRRIQGWALAAALLGFSCGKEIGRIPLKEEGSGTAKLALTARKSIDLWTSLDVSFTGEMSARYEVALMDAKGVEVARASCDPLNVHTKMMAVETSLGSEHSIHYQGKMDCSLTSPADGTYEVRASLHIVQRPAKLELKDASLVIKQ